MTTRAKITTTALLLLGLVGVGAADYYVAGRQQVADVAGNADGVAKAQEPDVAETLRAMNFSPEPSEDLTFLAQVSRDEPVATLVVLEDGDRAGSVSWIDGDAKAAFVALKEALLPSFSANVTGLSDRTIQDEGAPIRNVLTFRDPSLSEETLTFVRIRQRLYEFHATTGKESAMASVIEALTTR